MQGAWLHRTWAGQVQVLALAAKGVASWHDIPGALFVSDEISGHSLMAVLMGPKSSVVRAIPAWPNPCPDIFWTH